MNLKLYVTLDCDRDCSFCRTSENGRSETDTHMTETVGKHAVDLALKNTEEERKDLRVSFWGGEPFLNFPVLQGITKYAVEQATANNKTVLFNVITNGNLVNDEIAAFLNDHSFSVVLHLTDEFFKPGIDEFMAGFKDNFSQLLAIDEEPVLHLTLTPGSINKLYGIVISLVSAGGKNFHTDIGNYWDWTEQDIQALNKVYDQLTDFYMEKIRGGENIAFRDIDVRLNSLIRPRRYKYCGAGINEVSVTPDGNIYACLLNYSKFKNVPIGHVAKGFDENERNKYINYTPPHQEPCKDCGLDTACLHDCPVVNYQTTEKMDEAPLLLCEREKGLVKNATRFGNTLYEEKNQLFMKRFYIHHSGPGGETKDG